MWKLTWKRIYEMLKLKWNVTIEIFLVLLEIHFFKILFVITFASATSRNDIHNVMILILLSIAGYSNSEGFNSFVMVNIAILSLIVISGKIFHGQTQDYVNRMRRQENFYQCRSDGIVVTNIRSWFHWNKNLMTFVWPYFIYIIVIAMFYVFKIKRQRKRKERGEPTATPTVVFAGISRENSDKSFTNFLMFLINYGFYKFGIEITLVMFIIVIFTRLEIFTVFYIFWLVLIVFRNRDRAEALWKVATFSVLLSIIVQCLILGIFIIVVPCEVSNDEEKWSINYILYFIFNNTHSLNDNPSVIIGDFMLLILMSAQLAVFQQEKVRDVNKPFESGGSNRSILSENLRLDGLDIFEHSIYMPSEKIQNEMDVIKWYVFEIQFWVSLAAIFLLGTFNVDIFSLGYVCGSFVFLWQGTSFFQKKPRTIIKWWNAMLIYNLSSFIIKILLKVFGCSFGHRIPQEYCWLADLLDIPCSDRKLRSFFCESFKKYSPFLLDSIVFVVIIVQRRIFLSYYFINVINETFLTEFLASRGAEVVEDLRIKEVKKQKADAETELEELKLQMEKIKRSAYAMKMHEKNLYHDNAILNGGYYMFGDIDNIESESKTEVQFTREIKIAELVELTSSSEESSTVALKQKLSAVPVEAKSFFSDKINKLILFMHNKSENYISILQILGRMRRSLKESQSLKAQSSKETIEQKINRLNRDRQNAAKRRVDDKMKKLAVASVLRKKESTQTGTIIYKVGKESFYFLLSYTDTLAYCAVCLVQLKTSSILSLPMSLSVFLWATLTFPRPSKTFWTLLIAYTQIVVVIMLVSQSDLRWWDSKNYYIKIFGNKKQASFAVVELILLMVVFLHRAMLMIFGLWTSVKDFSFNDGKFKIKKCDQQTSNLITISLKGTIGVEGVESVVKRSSATDALIVDEDELKQKILFKHVVKSDYKDGKMKVKPVLKDRLELLKADEFVFIDNDGKDVIKLRQNEVRIKLEPLSSSQEIDGSLLVAVETKVEEPSEFVLSIVWLSLKQHAYIVRNFCDFISPKQHYERKRVDVYTAMFLCDFTNFLVLLFGFSEFVVPSNIKDHRSILNYLEENKVPTSLLFLLVIQFAMILIDRVIYMRKSLAGKVIFHIFTVFYTHVWLFFFLPAFTGRTLNETALPKLYYLIKCCYMLLSSYQIRFGYPKRILGNFLMKRYGIVWMVGFKIFMIIPFLFEIRVIMDWMCTETSLEFSEWVRVESIYAQVYQIKCQRLFNKEGSRRGEKKTHWKKYLLGGFLTTFLIGILWFPLILFALSSALGAPNIPSEITMSLQLGSYEPIYHFEASQSNIRKFSNHDWTKTLSVYSKSSSASMFLQEYEAEDVIAINFGKISSLVWNISPPNAQKIIDDIKTSVLQHCQLNWTILRKSFRKASSEIVRSSTEVVLDKSTQDSLILMLENSDETTPVLIQHIFQKAVRIQNDGQLKIISQLLTPDVNGNYKHNLTLQLHRSNTSSWWQVKEICDDELNIGLIQKLPNQNCSEAITLFMFNEKLFPSQISSLAVKGIAGLYFSLIVFASRLLRSSIFNFANNSIFVEELPDVDRIINLCQDIYLVRESQKFLLEEDLVAKLLFLYRSPETLVKWTKLKDE